MLETIVRQQIVFYFVGAAIAFGIVSKLVAGISLKRLVRAASNMSKSNHALMRLVRAKFEHACMVSDKVQNVGTFVEKYLYEYRIWGIRLHSWRQFEKTAIWMCGGFAAVGTAIAYYEAGAGEMVYQSAVLGIAGVVGLFLIYLAADEQYQLDAAKMYMVDFLENTYAHRYEKANQREIQVTVQRAEMDTESSDMEEEPDFEAEARQKREYRSPRAGEAVCQEAFYQESQALETAYRESGQPELSYGEPGKQPEIAYGERGKQLETPYEEPVKHSEVPYKEPVKHSEVPYREPVKHSEVPYREPNQPEVPYKDIPTVPDPMVQPGQQPGTPPIPQPVIQPGQTAQVRGQSLPETQAASSGCVQAKDNVRGEEESSRKEARIREILEEFLA